MDVGAAAAASYAPDLFAGRTVLITGGGTGIGRATAHGFARLGGTVVIASRDEAHLAPTVDELRGHGGEVLGVACNIRDVDSVEALLATCTDRFGGVDVLVNNAGGQFPAFPHDITDNGWRAVVDLNLNGTWNMCSRFIPPMVERGDGAVVNITHIYTFERGAPLFAHSGAARAGVQSLTATLGLMLGEQGVRVNGIAPGTVHTPGMEEHESGGVSDMIDVDIFTSLKRTLPMRRFGTEDEVAAAVLFLCSPAASWITGVTLRVDGAQYQSDAPGGDAPLGW